MYLRDRGSTQIQPSPVSLQHPSTMTSADSELENLSTEFKHISLKASSLLEKQKLHKCIFHELRNRPEFGQKAEEVLNERESDGVDERLEQPTEWKAELQPRHENILNDKEKHVNFTSGQMIVPSDPVPGSDIFYVEAPPNTPAPRVILDVDNFPTCPCRTQCPECQQFVTTETSTSVSSLSWLVCLTIASLGCVAGCCLVPFCTDAFKSTTHKCPRCRTSIVTIKKL